MNEQANSDKFSDGSRINLNNKEQLISEAKLAAKHFLVWGFAALRHPLSLVRKSIRETWFYLLCCAVFWHLLLGLVSTLSAWSIVGPQIYIAPLLPNLFLNPIMIPLKGALFAFCLYGYSQFRERSDSFESFFKFWLSIQIIGVVLSIPSMILVGLGQSPLLILAAALQLAFVLFQSYLVFDGLCEQFKMPALEALAVAFFNALLFLSIYSWVDLIHMELYPTL